MAAFGLHFCCPPPGAYVLSAAQRIHVGDINAQQFICATLPFAQVIGIDGKVENGTQLEHGRKDQAAQIVRAKKVMALQEFKCVAGDFDAAVAVGNDVDGLARGPSFARGFLIGVSETSNTPGRVAGLQFLSDKSRLNFRRTVDHPAPASTALGVSRFRVLPAIAWPDAVTILNDSERTERPAFSSGKLSGG